MAGVLGNVSFTEYADTARSVKEVIAFWYTGSGDYNGVAWGTTTNVFDGEIKTVAFYTGAGLPQNAYNIRVFDRNNVDVISGAGLSRTNTTGVYEYVTSPGAVSHSNLNVYVANANFNRNGYVILYIR